MVAADAAPPADTAAATGDAVVTPGQYQGRTIDLGRDWQGAQACAVWAEDDVRCYDSAAAASANSRPTPCTAWTLQLVSIDERGRRPAAIVRPRLSVTVSPAATSWRAIVTLDEPTESVLQYAPYTLEVNGVLQPGGG